MKKFLHLLASLFLFLPHGLIWAANPSPQIQLSHVRIDIHDQASIKRGAKFFASNCLSCHGMQYMTHNPIAIQAGITKDKMPTNNKEFWHGNPPPDLSLSATRRGADWLYTYFHSFYNDPSRPTNTNNLLVHNTSMPNVLMGLQGEQKLVPIEDVIVRDRPPQHFTHLELISQGSMTPQQFNDATHDLTSFLVYASDPKAVKRERVGIWVLGFLVILWILAYLLKKEYWKNIK